MTYDERLQHVSVLGAAGKMGSGILLLTAVEMADLSLKPENKGKAFVLNAIDVSDEALAGLMRYLRAQVLKMAEKKVAALRRVYAGRPDLIENGEVIDQYLFDVMSIVRTSTRIESAYDSALVFEAIREDPELKVTIFSRINENNKKKPWFFTNTSSIPITVLDTGAGLGGRILGFHFYNPPAVQKLVEVIRAKKTLKEVEEFGQSYAKNLRKVVVPSHDVAGFIGNGHFMRDILHADSVVSELADTMTGVEAIFAINKITQEAMIRPMGIFQLIDYVGVDVCCYILSVMNSYSKKEKLHSPMLDQFLKAGVKGGQFSDGTQKDGILKYEKGRPVAIYDLKLKKYTPVEEIRPNTEEKLGAMTVSPAWKSVVSNPDKERIFKTYFTELKQNKSAGARLAVSYMVRSRDIGKQLVKEKVAFSDQDVNTVLLTGFFHAYGPINDYI
ncbi:MAG: 3-hydroxyacyl-CoA dehydrogenase family protein [Bacteroidota bacterium]